MTLMRYFPFLYQFCYKPFLADIIQAKGITYDDPPHGILNTKRSIIYHHKDIFIAIGLLIILRKRTL